MTRHSSSNLLVLSWIVMAVFACDRQPEEVPKAREVWAYHERVVTQAVQGEMHSTDEFMEAVHFFREVAGVEIRVEIFTMGFMPIAETSEDLERVKEWYRENGHRLYYDSEAGRVRVR